MTPRKYQSPILSQLLKETPLGIRLRVLLQMEWADMNIQVPREATDEECDNAYRWAEKMSTHIIEEIVEWEIDGRSKKDKKCHTKKPRNKLPKNMDLKTLLLDIW